MLSSMEIETGFEADLALYHLGLGHFLPLERIARPFAEVSGDKCDFEIVYGINVGDYLLEDFPRKVLDRRLHAVRVPVDSGLSASGWSLSRLSVWIVCLDCLYLDSLYLDCLPGLSAWIVCLDCLSG